MKQQTLFKKSVAILTIVLLLLTTLLLCYMFTQKADAEMVIWEKIDYKAIAVYEDLEYNIYSVEASHPKLAKYSTFYIFIAGAGGMGGSSYGDIVGYGGGAGGMAVIKIHKSNITGLIFFSGKGGGTFDEDFEDLEYGDGYHSSIVAVRNALTPYEKLKLGRIACTGGKAGSSTAPGKGGTLYPEDETNGLLTLIYSQDGADGGEASNAFTVDLGFRKEYFIFRPAGTNLSGKGGGASVFHRGGDGGVLFQNGFNGSKGSGGGGASKGATQGGFGGDGYIEVYGSNM